MTSSKKIAETAASLLTRATGELTAAAIPSAALDASLILAHVLGVSREGLLGNPDKVLPDMDISAFQALILRRSKHEPVAYITGKKEFWSLDFCVTRATLIPRPDSETLVSASLRRVKDRAKPIALLDIGTGTGCLLIALLKELPASQGMGVDNNEGAILVAKENAKRHAVESRSRFIKSHWCDAVDGTFDLIVSNPPYIASGALGELMPDVAHFEPHGALDGGDDGLAAYRTLAPVLRSFLAKDGMSVFEVGTGQADAVSQLLQKEGFETEFENDLAGTKRCVVACRGPSTTRTH